MKILPEDMDRGLAKGRMEGPREGEGGVDEASWIMDDLGEEWGLGGVLRVPPNRNRGGGARFC